MPLDDPAAAYYFVSVVEDRGLAGGDGSLGVVEGGFYFGLANHADGGRGWFVTVANLRPHSHFAAHFAFEPWDGNPVEVAGSEGLRRGFGVGAHGNAMARVIDLNHVERVGGRYTESLALADGEVVDAGVAADDFAGG
jgi:hypothetical protein